MNLQEHLIYGERLGDLLPALEKFRRSPSIG